MVLPAVLALVALALVLFYPDAEGTEKHGTQPEYHINTGHIFGTYYNIRYRFDCDLEKDILATLQEFDASLSTFNQQSVTSWTSPK